MARKIDLIPAKAVENRDGAAIKNAQEEAKFQALQKQEQLQKEQEQLFVSRKQETLAFQQATIRKLQTLQNYLKTNEYNKIQD